MVRLSKIVFAELALAYICGCARVDEEAKAPEGLPAMPGIDDVKKAEQELLDQREVMEAAAASHSHAVEQVRMADDLNRRARDMAMAKGALESEAVASREAAARDTAVAVARHEATKISEAKAQTATEAIAFAAKKAADTVAVHAYADKTKAEAEEACITSKRMTTQANLMTAEAARQKSEYERVAANAADAKAQAKMAVMEKDAAKANLARLCAEDVPVPPGGAGATPCKQASASPTGKPLVVEPAITQASTLQSSPADGAAKKSAAVPVEVKHGLPQESQGSTNAAGQALGTAAGSGSSSSESVVASALSKIHSWFR